MEPFECVQKCLWKGLACELDWVLGYGVATCEGDMQELRWMGKGSGNSERLGIGTSLLGGSRVQGSAVQGFSVCCCLKR